MFLVSVKCYILIRILSESIASSEESDDHTESEEESETDDNYNDDNLVEGVGLKSLIEEDSSKQQSQVCVLSVFPPVCLEM